MKKLLLLIGLISLTISQAQIVNIPDANFKNALLNYYPAIDTNGDGEIQVSEALNVQELYVNNDDISDLTGIEDFTNLTLLNCPVNELSSLDLSNNTNLTNLDCGNNQLTSLNITNNPDLTHLECGYNQLTNLDLSNNTNLTDLHCFSNELNSLDLTNNTELIILDCDNNEFSSLDLSNNTNLTDLDCGHNQLISLDLTNNTNLEIVYCEINQLTNLNVNNLANLNELYCLGNQLTNLSFMNNTSLTLLSCSLNQLITLDVTGAPNLIKLICFSNQLSDIDLHNSLNLTTLKCFYNQLNNLDVTNCINLTNLTCGSNHLSSLDLSNNENLEFLNCYDNQIGNLDLSNNPNLITLLCKNNQLSNLDLSNNPNLTALRCKDNSSLDYINLKNGNNHNFDVSHSDFRDLPNLDFVCVDELNTNLTSFIVSETGHSVTFTEYCTLVPAKHNTISGSVYIDIDNNGCDVNDVVTSNLLVTADNGTESFGTFVLPDASYSMFTNDGNFTTTVTTNLPNYWSATPTQYTNSFTGFDNTFTADFCITANQTVNDVNVTLVPKNEARPGFNATYQIVYKNVGTTQLNGNVTIEFDETKLSFVNASEIVNTQTGNSLTFDYANLNPFETRTIDLEFNVFQPPTVNINDTLSFTTTVNPINGDYTPGDNIFTLNQTVVGSFDPNDITCLEGDEILLSDIDKYLHYVIRFQNTGTASAINIVVKNILDTKLDWSTLQLESTSHDTRVAIKNGNEIEFIFENINLPDSTTDEPNSHGFIAYKIKPKDNLSLGDVIPNKADIFFDFNEPIETNTATTTIVNTSNITEADLSNFEVYPIPADNVLNIKSKTGIVSIEIFNKIGQKIIETTKTEIDLANLTPGIYFVKVKDISGNFGVRKIVKK